MTPIEWAVLATGFAAVVWINWYFFVPARPAAGGLMVAGGVQEVRIAVKGGYDPAHIRLRAGVPVRLVFDRQEDNSCSEEIVISDFGVRRFLPAHAETVIEFTPAGPGVHEFTCGMGMLRGRLTIEGGA